MKSHPQGLLIRRSLVRVQVGEPKIGLKKHLILTSQVLFLCLECVQCAFTKVPSAHDTRKHGTTWAGWQERKYRMLCDTCAPTEPLRQ